MCLKAIDKFKEVFKLIFYRRTIGSFGKKILKYKYQVGLYKYKPVEIKNLYEDLNAIEYEALNYQLYENAITVLKMKAK